MNNDFETRRILNDPLGTLPLNTGDELIAALRAAVSYTVPALFEDTVRCAYNTLSFRDVSASHLPFALKALRADLKAVVPATSLERARRMIDDVYNVRSKFTFEKTFVDESTLYGQHARAILDPLLEEQNDSLALSIALEALTSGMRVAELHQLVLAPLLREIGRLWQRDEITISQEHVVTSAVERLMAQIIDRGPAAPTCDLAVISAAIGTSQHAVGARMVADAFMSQGWQSTYLGSNIPVEDLLRYIDSVSVDAIAISATMARDVDATAELVKALDARPIAPAVIVGGRAFSLHPSLWRAVGADGFAASPLDAVALAAKLVHCRCE